MKIDWTFDIIRRVYYLLCSHTLPFIHVTLSLQNVVKLNGLNSSLNSRELRFSLFQCCFSLFSVKSTPWTLLHALEMLRKNLRWPETNLKMLFIMHSTCPFATRSCTRLTLFRCSAVLLWFRALPAALFEFVAVALSTHGLGNRRETGCSASVWVWPKVEEKFRFSLSPGAAKKYAGH